MEDHIATMLNLRQLIIQAGGTIDDLQMSQALILSFPETPSWEIIMVQLIHGERLTPDGVSARLQAEANRHTLEKGRGQTALHTTTRGRRGCGRGRGRSGRGRNQNSTPGCGPQPDD